MSLARKIAQFLAATAPFVFLYIVALWFLNTLTITVSQIAVKPWNILDFVYGFVSLAFIYTVGFVSASLILGGIGYTLLTFYREQASKKTTHAYIGWGLSLAFNASGPGLLLFTGIDGLLIGFTDLLGFGFVTFFSLHFLTLLLWVSLNFCLSVVALADTLLH